MALKPRGHASESVNPVFTEPARVGAHWVWRAGNWKGSQPVIQFGKLPVAGLGIVAGGLLLGAGLASYANPSPKTPPAPPWASQLEPPIAVGETPVSYQTYPEDLSPPNLADGYAPAVAFTQMRVPVDPPLPRLDPRWSEARPSARSDDYALPDAAQPERTVPHYAALERADAPRAASAPVAEDDAAPANAEPAASRSDDEPADASPHAKTIHIALADGDD